MTFTPAQQAAISYDAPEILVSAAAGSGKTAVLTQRILRHISNNIGIDRLLVVTFTEAAAAEMKERVTQKIQEQQLANPSIHLANQAALLATADISTIHSFCRKLVKEHFQMLDIDPAFRVADDSELGLIKSQVMDELFEAEYAAEDNAEFIDLVDVYGGKAKDDRLDALVRRLYAFLESDPFPLAAAARYAGKFTEAGNALDSTPWARLIRKELTAGLDGIIEGLRLAMEVCHLPGGPEKYIDKIEENITMISNLRKSIAKPFQEMYQAFLSVNWGNLPAVREKDLVNAALKERAQRIRNTEAKDRLKNLAAGVFFANPGKMQADLAALAPRVAALMALVSRYAEAFAAEKRKRNLLDFSDLEHFAIKVLYPNGPDDMTPSHVAKSLSEKYHEVLIDEYQDSNKVQDLILSNLARQRFMVGDVKQSIYRFRRANPGLFVEKYNRYSPMCTKDTTPGPTGPALRIDLSQNFRSRTGVIDAVNFFFSQLMCPEVGEVSYDTAAALHAAADYPPLPEESFPGMWIELLDQSAPDEEPEPEEEPVSSIIAETRMIAGCIHEVLATRQVWDKDKNTYRPCKPGDIVILARSANSLAMDVIEELKNCGIDAIADMTAAFYQQPEIKTALAFLRVTDNPRQNVDLTAALSSPAYGFTMDELYAIRQHSVAEGISHIADGNSMGLDAEDSTPYGHLSDKAPPKPTPSDLYDHLKSFANNPDTPLHDSSTAPQHSTEGTAATSKDASTRKKALRFLSHLSKWRTAASYMPISRLIGMIYEDTQFPSHAAGQPGGEIREANLRLLLERAIEFEETSFKGLFHFIHYIERLYDTDSADRVAGGAAPAEDLTNRVRLMSIHKSKGLEFPVVITGFLGKNFNIDDERQPIILHGEEGIGPKYVNLKKRTRAKTLAHYGLARLTRRENLSEELRCLYVAMTRAKELLILTGRVANLTRSMEKWTDAAAKPDTMPSVYYRQSAGKYLDWIMPCLLRHQNAAALLEDDIPIPRGLKNHPSAFDIRIHHGLMQFDAPAIEKPPAAPYEPISLPAAAISQPLPSKLSITEIKRIYASDISPDSTPHIDPPPTFEPPAFIRADAGITPMRMGSALHTIVEHMDFHTHITPAAINELITCLAEKNLLSQEESEAIDRNKIQTLANSGLADRIRAAKEVHREALFVMAIPAAEIYPDMPISNSMGNSHAQAEESILVHGIIDCYFEEEGQLVLVDFKSENPGPNPQAWAETHRVQLQIYKKAIAEATAKPVKEVILYSFAIGAAVTVTT
ncbi:MAG: UvrD-helicase domain-containing protein [Defluviitaleaceae bacterium]|nr:UvrD-helicase domain-containing protein [Defluviitaleaceae bacterium]